MTRTMIEGRRWRSTAAASGLLLAASLLAACGGSTAASPSGGSQGAPPASANPDPGGAAPSQDDGGATASEGGDGPGASTDNGPIGGDIGDRSKGSVQAQITGGLTASVDLPFGAPLAQLLAQGPGTAYLPYTDPVNGTLFLTISSGNQLLVQYAGPNNVGLANGATPCELTLDALDAGQAKGSFTCKGMMLIQNDSIGSADMTGSFEAHR
jgi:hypothetical protein